MPRKRYRIMLSPELLTQAPAVATQAPASQVSSGPTASSDSERLSPAQQRMIQRQQQMGNQHALQRLGLIQRAPAQEKDDEKKGNDDDAGAPLPETVSGVNDTQNTRSLLMAATTAYKGKKYAVALLAFRILFSQTQSTARLIDTAICEIRMDLFKEAIHHLEIALSDDDISREDRTRAIGALDSARKLENVKSVGFISLPSNVDTENSPLGKEPRAIRNQVFSLYRTAEGAAKSEDYEAAFNAFKVAQDRLPHPVTQLNMAKILVMLGRYSEAQTYFERALSDRTFIGDIRKIAEIELETSKRFQGMRFDAVGQ